MISKDKILMKIKKLLALGNDRSNPHESYAALLKARKMMIDYHIQEDEVIDRSSNSEVGVTKLNFTYTMRYNSWSIYLVSTICRYNRCKAIIYCEGRYKRRPAIIGESEDREYVSSICNYANAVLQELTNNIWSTYYQKGYRRDEITPYTDSFAYGYVKGLNDHYEKQDQSEGSHDLMCIIPNTVIEYIDKLDLEDNHDNPTIEVDHSLYNQGYQEGLNFFNRTQVSGGNMRYLSQ